MHTRSPKDEDKLFITALCVTAHLKMLHMSFRRRDKLCKSFAKESYTVMRIS